MPHRAPAIGPSSSRTRRSSSSPWTAPPRPTSGSRPPSRARGCTRAGPRRSTSRDGSTPGRDEPSWSSDRRRLNAFCVKAAREQLSAYAELDRGHLPRRPQPRGGPREDRGSPEAFGRPRGPVPARRDRAELRDARGDQPDRRRLERARLRAHRSVDRARAPWAVIVLSFEAHGKVAGRSGAARPRGGAPGADRCRAPRFPCSTIGSSSAGGSIVGCCPPEASCGFMSRPCGSSIRGYIVGAVSVCCSSRAGSSGSCSCSGLSAAAPSGASPSACDSRRSSRTSRPCCRPAPPGRSTGRSRPGSGASSRISAWIGPPLGAGRSSRRGPAHAFVDSRRAFRRPQPVVQEQRVAQDLRPDSAGSRRPSAAARRLARRGPDRPPEPRAVRHAIDAPWSPSSRAERSWAGLSVGTALEERRWPDELTAAAPAPRRHLCQRPGAAARRARRRTRARRTSGIWPDG